VHHYRHTWFSKGTAVLLLLLLSFIYIEKAFHAHEKRVAVADAQTPLVKKTTECSICDFQLTRDGGLPENLLMVLPAPVAATGPVFHSSVYQSARLSHLPVRGPPAC